jgi:hypothetical protein
MEYNNDTYIKYDNQDIINNEFNFPSKINIDNITLKKKKLIEISKNLTNIEYLEIFNIIKEDNCNFSENKNGIFINLLNISEETIDKIFNFINFIKHKREDLMKHEEYLNIAKKNISSIIKNTENNIIINESDKIVENLDQEETIENSNYLVFSSDEDEDLENKILLKKKKIKYSGKKAKMIKSIKDSNDINKPKNRNKII